MEYIWISLMYDFEYEYLFEAQNIHFFFYIFNILGQILLFLSLA